MSKKTPKKKVVVKTKSNKGIDGKKSISPTVARSRTSRSATKAQEPMLFTRENYIYMGAGFLLVVLGLVLMSGGHMPDPNTWDPDLIYGFRRTVLAPVLILAGLVVEIYAIFKRPA